MKIILLTRRHLHFKSFKSKLFFLIFTSSCHTVLQKNHEFQERSKKISKNLFYQKAYSYQRILSDFSIEGPFANKIYRNFKISINPKNSITTDLFLTDLKEKNPLVIFMHGNKFSKQAHFEQAKHLSSWGFHCLTLDLPNTGEWFKNTGRVLEPFTCIWKV